MPNPNLRFCQCGNAMDAREGYVADVEVHPIAGGAGGSVGVNRMVCSPKCQQDYWAEHGMTPTKKREAPAGTADTVGTVSTVLNVLLDCTPIM